MDSSNLKNVLQDLSRDIETCINVMQYDAAANNARKVVERIVDFYIEENDISFEEHIDLKDKMVALEGYLSEERMSSFHEIRKIGNVASHAGGIDKNTAEYVYSLAKKEIKNTLGDLGDGLLPSGFPSIADEGWKICKGYSIEGKVLDDGTYVEEIREVMGIPQFLDEFYVSRDLPKFFVLPFRRTINGNNIRYECKTAVFVDGQQASKVLWVYISRDYKNNSIDEFGVKDSNGELLYYFNRYDRALKGTWVDNSQKGIQILEKIGYGVNGKLSNMVNPWGRLGVLFSHEPLVPFWVENKWVILDKDNNIAVVEDSHTELGSIASNSSNEANKRIRANIKYRVIPASDDSKSSDLEYLEKAAEDVYRLNFIRNILLSFFNKQDLCKDPLDINSNLFVADNELKCTFLEGFELGIRRNPYCVIDLFDTYKKQKYEFSVDDSSSIKELENTNLFEGSIGFVHPEIGFKQDIVDKILELGNLNKLSGVEGSFKEKSLSMLTDSFSRCVEKEFEARKQQEEKAFAERKLQEEKQKVIKEKKKKTKLTVFLAVGIPIAVVVFCISLCLLFPVIGIVKNNMPKRVNLNDYLKVEVTGYNEIGEIHLSLDSSYYDKYGKKVKYAKGAEHPEDTSASKYLVELCTYEIENNGKLKNGDVVEIKLKYPDDVIEKTFNNCSVKYKNITYTVSGLETVDLFDAYEDFSYSLMGVSTDGELFIESNLNSMGYNGLLYQADKTEGIKNGDIVTISLITESGDDIYEYCLDRFGKVPSRLTYEIEASGMPEYLIKYDQISEDFLNARIAEGEEFLKKDYTKHSEFDTTITSVVYTYIGNYFLVAKDEKEEHANKLIIVYKVETTSEYGNVTMYEAYGNWDIYSDQETIGYKWYDNPNQYHVILNNWHYGVQDYMDIYKEYISPDSEGYFVQNNMNE